VTGVQTCALPIFLFRHIDSQPLQAGRRRPRAGIVDPDVAAKPRHRRVFCSPGREPLADRGSGRSRFRHLRALDHCFPAERVPDPGTRLGARDVVGKKFWQCEPKLRHASRPHEQIRISRSERLAEQISFSIRSAINVTELIHELDEVLRRAYAIDITSYSSGRQMQPFAVNRIPPFSRAALIAATELSGGVSVPRSNLMMVASSICDSLARSAQFQPSPIRAARHCDGVMYMNLAAGMLFSVLALRDV
jgi:hypothetical protein